MVNNSSNASSNTSSGNKNIAITNTSTRKSLFSWQKWKCPFNPEDNDNDNNNDNNDEYNDGYEPFSDGQESIFINRMMVPAINVGDYYNLWLLHTGFLATEGVVKIIDGTPGVECLNIISPYRVRIGIGECFDEDSVRAEITDKLKDYVNNSKD